MKSNTADNPAAGEVENPAAGQEQDPMWNCLDPLPMAGISLTLAFYLFAEPAEGAGGSLVTGFRPISGVVLSEMLDIFFGDRPLWLDLVTARGSRDWIARLTKSSSRRRSETSFAMSIESHPGSACQGPPGPPSWSGSLDATLIGASQNRGHRAEVCMPVDAAKVLFPE